MFKRTHVFTAIISIMLYAALLCPVQAFATDIQPGTEPFTHDDIPFAFSFSASKTTDGAGEQKKMDNSSAYIRLDRIDIDEAWLYIDGKFANTWINCMGGANAIVTRHTSPGQYRIQNLVYERFGNTEARLTGWGRGNTGTITGAWSADSYTYRNYPFLNATPNPLVWE